MDNHTTSNLIQRHTINDLLAITGEEYQGDGIHIFIKKHKKQGPALQYPFRSDHFSIFIISEGELTLKLNLLEYQLKKNDLLIIAPNVIRQFVYSSECALNGIVFTADFLLHTDIQKKYIEPFDFLASYGSPLLHLETPDITALKNTLLTLQQKNSARDTIPFGLEILQHHFTAFIYEMASVHRRYNAEIKMKLTRKEDLTMQFLKLLPGHFKEERSVQFYAELLYVTPKHLTQTLKITTGKTAGEFIDEMVIMEAKVLLGNLSFSIAQIAETLFFSDQFFFSKFFKNLTGFTPTDYRRTL